MKHYLVGFCACAVVLCTVDGSLCLAQDVEVTKQVITADGKTIVVQGGNPYGGQPGVQVPPGAPVPVKYPPGVVPPGGKPPTSPQKEDKDKEKKESGKATPGAESDKPPAIIVRIDRKPTAKADPKELEVRPGPDGVVHFQFRGQNWPDILDWYAEIAGVSVDWQELPGDYLNISTQSGYKVAELGDLLNRLLLARGFTMLPQGEFVNVVKCEDLDASLVPRVRSGELDRLGEFDFVRVMFELDWMLASDVITELEPLLSKNGKLYALKTTNRIEAMDAVRNLREVQRLLMEEQQVEDGEPRLVQEFVLQYARAEDVRKSLSEFLGESSAAPRAVAGMSPQQLAKQQQQMMQMQMQMQQQMAAKQRSSSSSSRSRGSPTTPTKEAPVRMMVNPRRNSILVQAPPDKMATIAEAIKMIDVPEPGAGSLQAFLGRMQVYRLAQLDPGKLVESLQELGGLDPTTRLEVDETNQAIIAYATPADHHTIKMTVEKLDGSARSVEVIPLKRMAADEVAGTIQFLMAGANEKNSSRSDYWDPWSSYRRSSRSNEKPTDEFRVDADVENNRLLVRANEVELEEVVSILVKLGEVPQLGRNGDLTRVLEITPGDEAEAFLKRLQKDFKVLAPNQLILPELAPKSEEKSEPAPPASPTEAEASPAQDGPDAKIAQLSRGLYHTAVFQTPLESQEEDPHGKDESAVPKAVTPIPGQNQLVLEPPGAPPIVVSIGPDGRIVLASRDARALDLLEELAQRTAPPAKDYHIFHLENAPASWILLNLEEFFEDEDESDRRRRDRMSWMWGRPSGSSDGDQRRLSKRRPLKFISDLDTNTILVQGADARQLKIIADLIELYDVPEPVSSQNARVTKLFTVKYSKASIVADTIKDAYRDLLSSNDRALQQPGGKDQAKQTRGGGMTVISAFGFGEDSPPSDSRTSARFEGKLSIGVDDLSNTMLVSTEGENLMSVVEGMIEALDEAAKPVSQVSVVRLGRFTDGTRLQEVLEKVLAQSSQGTGSRAAQPKPPTRPPSASSSSRNGSRPPQPARVK